MYRVCEQMLLFVQAILNKSIFIGIISSQAIIEKGTTFPSLAFASSASRDNPSLIEGREEERTVGSFLYKPRRPIWVWRKAEVITSSMLVKAKEANTIGNRYYNRTWRQLDLVSQVNTIIEKGFPFVETFWTKDDAQKAFTFIKKEIADISIATLKQEGYIRNTPYNILAANKESNEVNNFITQYVRSNDNLRFNEEFVSIKSPDETILDMDYLLVDYFTEPSKIMVRVAKGEPSLQDHFINGTLVEKAVQLLKSNSLDITNKNLHEVITNQSIKDPKDPTLNLKSSIVEGKNKKVYLASAENTFVYIMIWKLLFPERSKSNDFSTLNILDGAGGYGSRLMAAIMLNSNYIGVEPNPLSTPGFNKMIKMLGSPQKQKMLEDGLPNALGIRDLPLGWADVVMFSPPMWGKEVYNDETVEKQSINMFNDEQLWLTQFLYASIDVLWNHLRIGGFIVFQSVRYDYIGEYMIKKQDAVFKGIISRVTSTGRYKPNWIWQKI
jgi:hypothetical protein